MGVQVTAPAGLVEDPGHSEHVALDVASSMIENLPGLHGRHSLPPGAYRPPGQDAQLEATAEEPLPGAQGRQAMFPVEYRPAVQFEHVVEALEEPSPAWQGRHAIAEPAVGVVE